MPGTTPSGLPYPLPTEPVADGADAIRALAEAADARFPTSVVDVTRMVNDTVGANVDANVVGANFPGSHPSLIGRSVILFGTLHYQYDAATNIFCELIMDGVRIGGWSQGGAPALNYSSYGTVFGIGIATTPHPSISMRMRSSASGLTVMSESRLIGIGGFWPMS